ncbi:MAG: hypothetical protein P8M10_05345 [Ilumatobacter sp.]|nr:hypothetical protein [Ilumatobacter sp.]MDG2438721.1 hypothetical protein [Ilumatobacter sp.]
MTASDTCPQPTFELGPPIPQGRMPNLERSAGSFEIAFPEFGTIKVGESSIVVSSESTDKASEVWARYGAWARAQWWASKGCLVLTGAAVGRGGKGIAIVGPTRVGCSVTALQLTRHRFGLVSDGFAVIGPDGRLIKGLDGVSVDRQVGEKLFSDYSSQPKRSGRDRVTVEGPVHGDAELAFCIVLSVRSGVTGVKVVQVADFPKIVKRLTLEPLLRVSGPTVTPEQFEPTSLGLWSVSRAAPESLEELRLCGPQAVARAIAGLISGDD